MRARIVVSLAIAALTAPLFARPAQAYVRALQSETGPPFYWPTSCAAVTIYLNGFSTMTSDEVAKSIAAAAHAWSPSEVTCPGPDGDGGTGHPYFEIVPSMSTGGPVPEVAYDGKNSIIFETQWKENAEAIAFTSHFSLPDGEIVDTDMEINASPESGIWANLDTGTPPPTNGQNRIDLQTAITHEFGHFIGLAHTCFDTGVDLPSSTTDDQGQPVPACPADLNFNCPVDPVANRDVPQAQSVMWFSVCHESITKRVLSPDDVRAICDIYPAAQDPHACTLNLPDDGCGCATGGAPPIRAATLSLLALGVAVAHARRRRRLRSDRDRRAAL